MVHNIIQRRSVTLIELIIVIIVIGIASTLGISQYAKMWQRGSVRHVKLMEESRLSEARRILGDIRNAQEGYKQEYDRYANDLSILSVSAPTACATAHYFSYETTNATITATRCSTTAGKTPAGPAAYTVTLTLASGAWGGSGGYY